MKKILPILLCLVVIIAVFTVIKRNNQPEVPTAEITGETSFVSVPGTVEKEIKIIPYITVTKRINT